jgi:hypothetical protein
MLITPVTLVHPFHSWQIKLYPRPHARKGAMSETGARRDKAALSSGCKPHPANAPAGSNRSSYGGTEVAEACGKRVTNW